MTVALRGFGAVVWSQKKAEFPYVAGMQKDPSVCSHFWFEFMSECSCRCKLILTVFYCFNFSIYQANSIHLMFATLDDNATFHAAQLLVLPCTGMVPIFLSWIISPVLSGIFTTIIFLLIRTLILRRKNSLTKAMIGLPILVGGTFWLVVSFIIQTGTKNKTWSNRGGTFSPVFCQLFSDKFQLWFVCAQIFAREMVMHYYIQTLHA